MIRPAIAKQDLFESPDEHKPGGGQPEVVKAVDAALARYGSKTESDLKTATYLTAPMRSILRFEQKTNRTRYNEPIDFLVS